MSIEVVIENFQSIEKVEFSIDSFTVIEGPSDIGKSAIMRAIDAALSNDRGDYFIRRGTKSCKVVLNFVNDGFKIEWTKPFKKGGSYVINDDVDNPLEKLAGAVPDQIIDFGISEIKVKNAKDKGRVQPQICSDQHNTLFMLYESPQVKAELLSEISEVTKMSRALKLASKDLKSQKKEIKAKEKVTKVLKTKYDIIKVIDIETLKNDLEESFNTLNQLKSEGEELEEIKEEYVRVISICDTLDTIPDIPQIDHLEESLDDLIILQSLSEGLLDVDKKLNCLSDIPDILDLSDIESSLEDLVTLQEIKDELDKVSVFETLQIPEVPDFEVEEVLEELLTLHSIQESLTHVDEEIYALGEVPQIQVDLDFESLENKIIELSELNDLKEAYFSCLVLIKSSQDEIESLESQIKDIEEDLKNFDMCPFCDSEVSLGSEHEHNHN